MSLFNPWGINSNHRYTIPTFPWSSERIGCLFSIVVLVIPPGVYVSTLVFPFVMPILRLHWTQINHDLFISMEGECQCRTISLSIKLVPRRAFNPSKTCLSTCLGHNVQAGDIILVSLIIDFQRKLKPKCWAAKNNSALCLALLAALIIRRFRM